MILPAIFRALTRWVVRAACCGPLFFFLSSPSSGILFFLYGNLFHSFVRPLPPVIIANAPAIPRVKRGESLLIFFFLLAFPRKRATGQFHPIYDLVLVLDLPSLPFSPPSANVPIIPHSLVLVSNQLRHTGCYLPRSFCDCTAPSIILRYSVVLYTFLRSLSSPSC